MLAEHFFFQRKTISLYQLMLVTTTWDTLRLLPFQKKSKYLRFGNSFGG